MIQDIIKYVLNQKKFFLKTKNIYRIDLRRSATNRIPFLFISYSP